MIDSDYRNFMAENAMTDGAHEGNRHFIGAEAVGSRRPAFTLPG
jgi:hypothetical protein